MFNLHPIMVGIVTANTSLTLILWNFLFGQVFCKKIEPDTESRPQEVPV